MDIFLFFSLSHPLDSFVLFQDYGTLLCYGINEIGAQIEPCIFNIVPAGKLCFIHWKKIRIRRRRRRRRCWRQHIAITADRHTLHDVRRLQRCILYEIQSGRLLCDFIVAILCTNKCTPYNFNCHPIPFIVFCYHHTHKLSPCCNINWVLSLLRVVTNDGCCRCHSDTVMEQLHWACKIISFRKLRKINSFW